MPKATNILWIDQAEYYFLCGDCYEANSYQKWSGSTRSPHFSKTRKDAYEILADGIECDFCRKLGEQQCPTQ